jgi:hypothetical protein
VPQNFNFAKLTGIIALCLALAINTTLIVTLSASNSTPVRIIDSGGTKISSIYHGLKPDPRFASGPGSIVDRKIVLERSLAGFRTVTFRDGKHFGCNLLATALRGARAAAPRPHQCNGQYMVAQSFQCSDGCDLGNSWDEYFNTGTEPCNGYYYPNLIQACNGCELAEAACNSCL